MSEKPTTAAGYSPDEVARVKAVCLYLATKLGDLMDDLVIVGGLVPSLLIDQDSLPQDVAPHAGTMDLDVGLTFALINEERYTEVERRLRSAGFHPDRNAGGNPSRQRWRISNPPVTVDFLVEPESMEGFRPGGLFPLTRDWAAIVAPGLHLAFENNRRMPIGDRTIFGEAAERQIRVCGAGAFVVLKALAFRSRGENKDAYDLFYLLRNYGAGVSGVADELRPYLSDSSVKDALAYLRADFATSDSIGPYRVAEFLYGQPDPEIQADVVGFVIKFMAVLEESS